VVDLFLSLGVILLLGVAANIAVLLSGLQTKRTKSDD
jgi:hypothetical protein